MPEQDGKRIPARRIGRDGPLTGVLSLGSWHTYDRMAFSETVAMLRIAVDAGITLFDVGVYGLPSLPPVFTDVLFSAAVRAAGIARDEYLLSAKLWLEEYPAQSFRDQLDNALMRAAPSTPIWSSSATSARTTPTLSRSSWTWPG